MNSVLIYGEPGCGKTTIVSGMLTHEFEFFSKPFAHYINPKTGVCILGNYHADTIFLGTDKLSMSVQPLVIDFMLHNQDYNYIIEGDRLFNEKFIAAMTPKIIIITATDAEIQQRRSGRGSDQNPAFLKAKSTKIRNITHANNYYALANSNGCNLQDIRNNIHAILAGAPHNIELTKVKQHSFF